LTTPNVIGCNPELGISIILLVSVKLQMHNSEIILVCIHKLDAIMYIYNGLICDYTILWV